MRRILFAIMMVLLLSGISISQSLQFHVYEAVMIPKGTEKSILYDADFTVIFTNEYILFKEINIKWEFIGNVFKVSKMEFYSYALGMDGVRCKVWFRAMGNGYALLGLEYEDYNFLYKMKIINIRRT